MCFAHTIRVMQKKEQQHCKKLLPKRWASPIELTQAASEMDKHARHDLVELLMDRVRKLSFYLSGRTWEPEDLAQTSLIEILNSAGNFRGESSLERWADRITVHTAYKQVKKSSRREELRARYLKPSDEYIQPDVDAHTARTREKLSAMLTSLKPERKEVLVLRHMYGYSVAEISEMTGSLINTVRGRLLQGRKQLRKKILADPDLKEWGKKRKR